MRSPAHRPLFGAALLTACAAADPGDPDGARRVDVRVQDVADARPLDAPADDVPLDEFDPVPPDAAATDAASDDTGGTGGMDGGVLRDSSSPTDSGPTDSGAVDAATPPPTFALTGPVLWTTAAMLERAWRRVEAREEPFYSAWRNVRRAADDALGASFTPYQQDDFLRYFNTGRAHAQAARHLAIAYQLTRDGRYLAKARQILLAWADDSVANSHPGSGTPHSAGLVIGRVISIFADAYALVHANLSATERSRVQGWFRRMIEPIRQSQRIWVSGSIPGFSPPYLGQQYFNNHLGAQTLGLAAIGYATSDATLVRSALRGADNPRDLETLIGGVILMPGDALYRGDPTLTSGAPAARAGEIYDRYRVLEDKGLHYAHIHLRFLTLMALMARNNGDVDYFAFTSPGGENLRLPFQFYAPFVVSGRDTVQGGYYAGSRVDFGLVPLSEVALSYYPTSVPIREALELRSRVVLDRETFGWSAVLIHGRDDVADRVGRWEFDRAGRMEGWEVRQALSAAVTGGVLRLTITGADPGLMSPAELAMPTAGISELRIRMRNGTADTLGQVFFTTDASPSFADNRVSFALRARDAGFTEYVASLGAHPNWRGTLTQLRFDPVGSATSGTVEIDWIRLTRR